MITENYQLKEDEILDIRSDRLFHDLWNEKEMDTIEWTVMQILNCKYEDIHGKVIVGNARLINKSKDDKQKFVDLVVYYNNIINIIELNNNANKNYLRNVLYSFNAINNSYLQGNNYADKKVQCILVNLNWYNSKELLNTSGKEEIIYPYPTVGQEEKDYLLKIININLEYYATKCYNGASDKDVLWKLFTRTKKDDLKKITASEELLANYYNKIEHLSHSKEYCRMVWDERIENNLRKFEAYTSGKDEGIQEGIQKGIEKKQKEMILNMHNDNLPIETISKYANLTKEKVEEIIKNN